MAGNMTSGTIDTEAIYNVHQQIKDIVTRYNTLSHDISDITNTAKENWVGDGETEFESQYKILISKVEDFGDTLLDIYNALVKAEADYEETDDQIRQNFVMAMQE